MAIPDAKGRVEDWFCRGWLIQDYNLRLMITDEVRRLQAETLEAAAEDCDGQATYHEGGKDQWNKASLKAFKHQAERLRAAATAVREGK